MNYPKKRKMTDTREQLFLAVRQNKCIRVRELVDPFVYSDGYQLLQIAVEDNHTEMIEILLDNGCRVNSKNSVEREGDDSSDTPLQYAVKNGNKDVVQLLLSKGSATDVFNRSGETPLHCAVDKSLLKITEQLLRSGADVSCISRDSRQYTPLHCAAEVDDNEAMTNLLLNNGADVNAKTKSGFTALHLACQRGFSYVVKALLEYKADVECRNPKGSTPLIHSASKGNVLIIEMLLKKGANINAKDRKYGRTVLHYAALAGHYDALKVLLKENSEVNLQDIEGQTPLHLAASSNAPETVKVLLKHGANIDDVDNEGQTALHIASKKGYDTIVKLLLKFGADVNIITKRNRSPLDVIPYIYSDEEDDYDSDDSDDSHFDYDYGKRRAEEILIKRLIAMKIGNLYLNKKNKRSVRSVLRDNYYVRHCRKEVERMKNEQIENTKLKLYDILTKDVGWLAKYAKNGDIVDSLMSGCYEDEFPIYFADLRRNMKKAVERNHLIEKGQRFLGNLLGFPYACADQILQFLSNVDIKSMIQAYEQSLK